MIWNNWTWVSSKLVLKKLKQQNCAVAASSLHTLSKLLLTNKWTSPVKPIRRKNNNPNASNMRWLDIELSSKWKIRLSENLFSFSCVDEFLLWMPKKRTDKKYLYPNCKINSLVCNINYDLIVPIYSATTSIFAVLQL